jgi:diadenosine tetraphosphate (Ap4A) HIT family hydrolase
VSGFVLDPRLAADSLPLASLALSELRLMDDARWPWLLLVPRVAGASELLDLDRAQRLQLLEELDACARALRDCVRCDKLNIAALGNVVAQLHVHVVARRRDDAAWPRPVWGVGSTQPWLPGARDALREALLQRIAP